MKLVIDPSTKPIKKKPENIICIHCEKEIQVDAKLFAGHTHWQIDQDCPECSQRLHHLNWRQYVPEKDGHDGLEELTLKFRVVCEEADANRLAWLNGLDNDLCQAIAKILELSERFNVSLTEIGWKPEEDQPDEPADDWYGRSCDFP